MSGTDTGRTHCVGAHEEERVRIEDVQAAGRAGSTQTWPEPDVADPLPPQQEDLPPTEYLITEVLAARWRLGEQMWTFPSRLRPPAQRLAAAGLVQWKTGVAERTIQVWLTEAGRQRVLSEAYEPPGWPVERDKIARALDAEAQWLREQAEKGSGGERRDYRIRAISWDEAARLVRRHQS